MSDAVVWNHGKQYVTKAEFAERMGVTVRTVNTYIKDGIITAGDINKSGTFYIAWETQKRLFENARDKKKKFANKDKQPPVMSARPKELAAIRPDSLDSLSPSNKSDSPEDVINLGALDPYKYPECWVVDENGDSVENPITHKPELDLDKLKSTVQVLLAEQKKAMIDRTLIPKEEIVPTLQYLAQKIVSYTMGIPNRFGASWRALAEELLNRELTAEEMTRFTNTMKADAQRQCEAFRDDIKRFEEEENA